MRSNWVLLFLIILVLFVLSPDLSRYELLGSLEVLVERVQPPAGFCPPENTVQVDVSNRNVIILVLNAVILSILLVSFILRKLQSQLR